MVLTVILTHENADFDAVASQLAACKLNAESVPVLSRRLNRNVQSFLNEYADQFPFLRSADWHKQEVDQLIVVDSQTYSSLKGIRSTIPTRFIDHHPLAMSLETYQEYSGEPLGATVTLLIEQIQEQRVTLTPLEATLLMLGIYDDTGSLIYGTTTTRDLLAAAWLHQQGAMLDVVRKYLDRPLNDDQRMLYTMLIDSASVISVNDILVVMATATVDHVVEEVSVLAHKVREMYEGNAVFLLVAMKDGSGKHVQLVARSAAESLDVGEIARAFGGGGHSRAAAAQIRDVRLDDVQRRLMGMLGHDAA
jgi:tRNA nucleotidyltransferase (CCA-adding enzyme)